MSPCVQDKMLCFINQAMNDINKPFCKHLQNIDKNQTVRFGVSAAEVEIYRSKKKIVL